MDETPRYLLGRAERLTRPIFIPRSSGPKTHPYESVANQRARLSPRLQNVSQTLEALPDVLCPENRAVATITLHPNYFAKSYFPSDLLRHADLRAIGSRPLHVSPEAGEKGMSTTVFVAGKRPAFRAFANAMQREQITDESLLAVEDVRLPTTEERVRVREATGEKVLEVILHAPDDWESVVDGFDSFLQSIGGEADLERRHYLPDLCFMPVKIEANQVNALAAYTFVRVVRNMPAIRAMKPKTTQTARARAYSLPDVEAIDRKMRVAIFDGGLDAGSPIVRWANSIETSNLNDADPESVAHGTQVTSALLFGSLADGEEAARPYAEIDHYRVLDVDSHDANGEYYDVLDRIVEVVEARHYDFINLSIGPCIPIEDDEIHPWTAKLDNILASGKTLLVSAVGNDGDLDRAAGLARVQPPADGVNILSVGATDCEEEGWDRAEYSCVGPGRSPGITKPDVVSFGGSNASPFYVLTSPGARAVPQTGTSYAAPSITRLAIALKAHFGEAITPLGIRALLVHHADSRGKSAEEVGWGVVTNDLDSFVVCPAGTAHILYQGTLEPRQFLRADIPVPDELIPGFTTIKATFCITSDIDPKDPSNYTRSGIIPTFRPNRTKFTPVFDKARNEYRTPSQPDSASFFKISEMQSEHSLREDALKWETVLRREQRFRGTLNDPMFDIHYNPREGGADASDPKQIAYALVITIAAPKMPDIYNKIAVRYRTQLEAIVPVVTIPLKTS